MGLFDFVKSAGRKLGFGDDDDDAAKAVALKQEIDSYALGSDKIDVDVSGVLRRDMTIDEAGDALIEMIRRTANGRNTAAEALGHREFVMTKLYRSA